MAGAWGEKHPTPLSVGVRGWLSQMPRQTLGEGKWKVGRRPKSREEIRSEGYGLVEELPG